MQKNAAKIVIIIKILPNIYLNLFLTKPEQSRQNIKLLS